MTVHSLREALTLVPEAAELCKAASISDDLLTDSEASTLASYLRAAYLTKVANQVVPEKDLHRINTAVALYGLMDKAAEFSQKMAQRHVSQTLEKQASDQISSRVHLAEMLVEDMSGNLVKAASAARDLYDSYGEYVTSPLVRRYACGDVFVKEAAVRALRGRAAISHMPEFEKIASIVEASDETKLTQEDLRNIASCVTQLDKKAGLLSYNFYAEAFITKEAAASCLTVTVDKSQVPVENILKAPIGNILGEDVAKEIGSDPYQAKAVVESLPLDMQRLLLQRVR